MIEITSNKDFFELIGESPEIIIADFYAPWCVPCQRLFKILPNLETDLAGVATIAKIDTDVQTDLKGMYDVKSIPTFVFFQNSQEVHRFSGIKTLNEIKSIVSSLLLLRQS